jgi:hypothetical protein
VGRWEIAVRPEGIKRIYESVVAIAPEKRVATGRGLGAMPRW